MKEFFWVDHPRKPDKSRTPLKRESTSPCHHISIYTSSLSISTDQRENGYQGILVNPSWLVEKSRTRTEPEPIYSHSNSTQVETGLKSARPYSYRQFLFLYNFKDVSFGTIIIIQRVFLCCRLTMESIFHTSLLSRPVPARTCCINVGFRLYIIHVNRYVRWKNSSRVVRRAFTLVFSIYEKFLVSRQKESSW